MAEALVLLPGVDSVTTGRQLFTRAAARDLQVSLHELCIMQTTNTVASVQDGAPSTALSAVSC